jgi:hypothetical protein
MDADAPTTGIRRNATAVAGAKNATMSRKNATADEPMMADSPAPKTGAKDAAAPGAKDAAAPGASPAPAKKSGAAVATTGFAAAVAGSVVLLQLVL